MVSQSRVNKLGRVSAVRFVKVLSYSVIFVDGDTLYARPACSDGNLKGLSALRAVRYHATREEGIQS